MKLVGGNQEFDGFESGEANEFDLGIVSLTCHSCYLT